MLVYEGGAALGQYSVLIMVEDFPSSDREAEPLSTVSVHLLITGQRFISTFIINLSLDRSCQNNQSTI